VKGAGKPGLTIQKTRIGGGAIVAFVALRMFETGARNRGWERAGGAGGGSGRVQGGGAQTGGDTRATWTTRHGHKEAGAGCWLNANPVQPWGGHQYRPAPAKAAADVQRLAVYILHFKEGGERGMSRGEAECPGALWRASRSRRPGIG